MFEYVTKTFQLIFAILFSNVPLEIL